MVVCRGRFQPLFDEIDMNFGCSRTSFRFLLKGVEHVDHVSILHRINSPIGIAVVIFDYFQNRCAAESA